MSCSLGALSRETARIVAHRWSEAEPWVGNLLEGETPQGAQENQPVIPTTIGLCRMKDINLNKRSQPPNL